MHIERYRQQQIHERFLLEKKFEAISALRDDYGKMVKLFSRVSLPVEEGPFMLPVDHKDQYLLAIETVMHKQNHFGTIFSDRFMEQLIYHTWVHLGVYFDDVSKAAKYRSFVWAVSDEFDDLSKQELGLLSPLPGNKFDFSKWTNEEFDSRGAPAFLKQNFDKWRQSKKTK